jgi:hypothetical protein|eukprot:COSAG01_NODE_1777_length_9258_cov_7.865284_10_plen_108_part_00
MPILVLPPRAGHRARYFMACAHCAGRPEPARRAARPSDAVAARAKRSDSSATAAADSERDMYIPSKVIGNGSFGVVFQAHHKETREVVAIKKVLQDRRFKVRSPVAP